MEGEIGGMGQANPEYVNVTELYIVMGILSFLSIMGTAGNALVLYVFAKKKDRLTSTLFILSLAFVDLVTCLIVVPYTMYMEYIHFMVKYDIACKIYQFLITSNIPFSALVMVAIAIDRYFCICHPFMHAINIHRAKIMIAGLALFAAGLGVIVALMYGVYQNPYDQLNANATENGTSLINITFNDHNETEVRLMPIYTGECAPNTIYLKREFQHYYQKAYTAMYLVCLIIVIVLYILIYNSVLTRRTKRQKQKSKSLPLVTSTQPDDNCNSQEETLLTSVNGDALEVKNGKNVISPDAKSSTHLSPTPTAVSLTASGPMTTVLKSKSKEKKKDDKERRKSTKKDRNRIANLKTAAMLFVVTVVFIVTFLPAFLMALQLIPYNLIIFYMYFANNVANPVIYSFMNKNFRDDLKKLFCRR